ncbi:MAG: arsenite methyltransferase, partial [Myxococcales bacterium]|nr:arsenite methyltransferase [Myxococcales bacterium]
MSNQNSDQVRGAVREVYANVARGNSPGCCGAGACGPGPEGSLALGYSNDDLAAVPEGANLGLGCGNPQMIANLSEGETVLDLGSGAGFDCFLAAARVGPQGRVIGVDMTPDMVSKARDNAAQQGAENVEFRLGEIERLPIADQSIDLIMSNCVINLSPDKVAVFDEAFRVLKPGGRLAISDVVALQPMPVQLAEDLAALAGCVAGAVEVHSFEDMLATSGFEGIKV